METQYKPQGKRMNHDRRGQKGSVEVRRVPPVIDLNWRRMNERREIREPYYSQAKEPVVIEVAAVPYFGSMFGVRLAVRGSSDYYL